MTAIKTLLVSALAMLALAMPLRAEDAPAPANVLDKVAAAVKDNALSISVDNDTLGTDPAVGVGKQLRVKYTIDGVAGAASAMEGETLTIANDKPDKKLVITEAMYGVPVLYVDVTAKVIAAVKDGKLTIDATNDNFGDPAVGTGKELRVEYTVGGTAHTAKVAEGESLSIPAAADGTGDLVIKSATYGVLP